MSLVSFAHNPCYQLRPKLSITKASQGSVLDLRTYLLHRSEGKIPRNFLAVFLFLEMEAFGLKISLRCDWLIGTWVLWMKVWELLCYRGRCESKHSSWQDNYKLQHRCRPIRRLQNKYHVFLLTTSNLLLYFTVL